MCELVGSLVQLAVSGDLVFKYERYGGWCTFALRCDQFMQATLVRVNAFRVCLREELVLFLLRQ
jgi:hypothetical protein